MLGDKSPRLSWDSFLEVRVRISTFRSAIFTLATATALTLVAAAPAKAQTADVPQVGVGVNIMSIYEQTAFGLNVDLAKTVKPVGNGLKMGLVGDLGVNWFEGATQTSFAGGLRFTTTTTSMPFYFQFLLGAVHVPGATELLLMPGGGVKFAINEQTTAKVQLDLPMNIGEFKTWTGLRIGGGIVFEF
jgi:hypothetical protein